MNDIASGRSNRLAQAVALARWIGTIEVEPVHHAPLHMQLGLTCPKMKVKTVVSRTAQHRVGNWPLCSCTERAHDLPAIGVGEVSEVLDRSRILQHPHRGGAFEVPVPAEHMHCPRASLARG
ncbi:hypothetical protein WH91_08060 [Devosia psychrophila]|uniref:Uncharacterized protein n=1 Tax=Devosia psychrophila TaxID=728005 RepID=A0ABR5DZM4_9HYPH|nr:hypothetical protein WH91_08060 [Devosia psychrophila]